MMKNVLDRVEIIGEQKDTFKDILSSEALVFITNLVDKFNTRILELLQEREKRQLRIQNGETPNFLDSTKSIRSGDWKVASIPDDLLDRRVEITGPTDRKMVINALNSGASVFMADFEDSNSPTWSNLIEGQINLFDAVRKTITFTNDAGKFYQLKDKIAVLLVRPRGLHLPEFHFHVDGKPIQGCLLDFGLYFFHNAKYLLEHGSGSYFYLPKLQSHLEARLWNDVFVFAQQELGIPQGSIRATVLIEHILASFEMDEILYELRDHSAGLNCGRWDYIFSFIKTFKNRPDYLIPDRDQVTMTTHFMESYVKLLIQTCHKRGIHAMGGMAAQIPIKNNDELNNTALEKVRQDKLREVKAGHDGTWVAHPGLVDIAKKVFDEFMPEQNQITKKLEPVNITQADLIKKPAGTITEAGVRKNVNVGIQYLATWLSGNGCVPIYNLMEDAATAEICRTQLWQWVNNKATTDKSIVITPEYFKTIVKEEREKITDLMGNSFIEKIDLAINLFDKLTLSEKYSEFLTLEAYQYIA